MGDVLPLRRPTPAEPAPAPGAEPLWRQALGEELRAQRAARGERIADVAGRAGISPQYLSEIERGRKDPSSEMLEAVAGSLDLTVGRLVQRAGRRLAAPGTAGGPVQLAA